MGFSSILDDTKEENQDVKNSVPVSDPIQDKTQDKNKLPPDLINTIQSIIDSWCMDNDVNDLRKASALVWGAVCMIIGQYIKQNKILYDIEKTAARGGACCYDVEKVNDLIDIWVYCCKKYAKTPLINDFIDFSGVSKNWFYGINGHNEQTLTSAGGRLAKKIYDIQAGAVASGIVDGRENPTGKIYFSKAVLGWSEDGSRRQDLQNQNESINSFPDLAGLLPQKKE